MPRQTIGNVAFRLLSLRRALDADELGKLVAEAGATRSAHPTRAVSRALGDDPRFLRLDDGRWVSPTLLLGGTTLTHRLTQQEAARDALALSPDLAPLASLARAGLLLPDGRELTFAWDADASEVSGVDTDVALTGPPGWIGGAVGDLLHVRLTGSLLRAAPGPEPGARSRLTVRRIAATARAQLERLTAAAIHFVSPAVSIEMLFLGMLVDDPDLLRDPLPPLGDALTAAGLEVHRGWIGSPGTDWQSLDEFMAFDDADWDQGADEGDHGAGADPELAMSRDELSAGLAEAFGLGPSEVEGLEIVLGAFELSRRLGGFEGPEGSETYAKLASMFRLPGIARFLAGHARSDSEFEPFVAAVAGAARGGDAAGPRFVLAACAEGRHDVLEAERLFRSALEADPDHALALVEVARYETDRGRYPEAVRHLRAAYVPPDDPERAWLEALVRPAFAGVGRNAPCPCGSGRKYKVCHLGQPGDVATVEPSRALLHKLSLWLSEPDNERTIHDLEMEIGVPRPTPEGSDAQDVDGPLVIDVALFDRGCLDRFLEVRGVLLPEHERALGRSWLGTRRSLYEVQAVRPGVGLALRDLLAADEPAIELGDRSLSRQAEVLDLLCLRLLPDGSGGVTSSDAVLVPRPQRGRVMDLVRSGDGVGLLRWIASPNPMPRLSNMEGEPLLLVTVTYRVPGATDAMRALGRKLRDEENGRFVEMLVRDGQEWIRGSITFDGDRATVEANSARRAARLERTLLRAAPGSRLIHREERGVEEALAAEHETGPASEAINVGANPELAEVVEQFIRRHEVSWVDESIPALGGLTPRQALTDTRARPELEALLDDMAWQLRRAGGTGLMDPVRIRALLGIGPSGA